MSLKADIENAVLKSLGNPEDKGQVPELAKDLSNAIVEFIKAQDFQITEMKSRIEIERISTTADIPANIPTETQMATAKPIINFLNKMFKALSGNPQNQPFLAPLQMQLDGLTAAGEKKAASVQNKGVNVPFNLTNKGNNDAGELLSTAYAYIGGAAPLSETNEKLTKVQLLEVTAE
jgi:hypothetical protein